MSTLKTNNIEHLDASTPSIQTTIGGGTILAGVSTVSGTLNVGSNITLNTDGSATFAGSVFSTTSGFDITLGQPTNGVVTYSKSTTAANILFYGLSDIGGTAQPKVKLFADGSATFVGGVQVSDLTPGATDNSSGIRLNASGSIQLGRSGTDTLFAGYNTSSSGGSIAATSTIRNDGYAAFGGTNSQFFANGEVQLAANKINIQPDGSAAFASSGSVAAVTGKVSTNNGGYNCFRGVNSSDAEVFYVSHNGRVGATDGIIFGSDTAAANVLDDYEEGTWTPTLIQPGTTTDIPESSFTTFVSSGEYVKIGDVVYLTGSMAFTGNTYTTSNTSQQKAIGGLPYQNGPGAVGMGNFLSSTAISQTTSYLLKVYPQQQQDFLRILMGTNSGSTANPGAYTADGSFNFSVVYNVS